MTFINNEEFKNQILIQRNSFSKIATIHAQKQDIMHKWYC